LSFNLSLSVIFRISIMLLSSLIGLPVIGVIAVSSTNFYQEKIYAKLIALVVSVLNLSISL